MPANVHIGNWWLYPYKIKQDNGISWNDCMWLEYKNIWKSDKFKMFIFSTEKQNEYYKFVEGLKLDPHFLISDLTFNLDIDKM